MTRLRWFAAALLLGSALMEPLLAQQRDTVAPADSGVRPERRPPVSARRAFATSLILPGYAQSVLGRRRSGAVILAFEAVSIVMIREANLGIREARRAAADSIPVSYVDASGNPATRYERTAFPASLIRSRRTQREDWIAVLVATHLFAAADGLVAAILWDLPAEIDVTGTPRNPGIGLRLNF